ncbi:MAG: OmpA family protein [Myxococcota bacterium]
MLTLATLLMFSAAPPTDKLDALDFDQGAMLTEEAPSWSTGVGAWTPWRLSDGSPMGWCSPDGQLGPAAFVWQLDGAWNLETLVVDDSAVEESGYPGISAKSVELLVAPASGAFKSLGTFALPQGKKKSFPLPKGTTAERVKLIIKGNWGHEKFIELGEVDLLGTRVTPPVLARFEGVYQTNYGPMRLAQDGDQVYGCYDWGSNGGFLWGTATGRVVKTLWYEPGETSDDDKEGTATFAVLGRELWGVYFSKEGEIGGEWTSTDSASVDPPKCTPRKKGQLGQRLAQKGRLALYGIRFDTNSDVPRPESEATLTELLGVLKDDPSLTLVVEGHTDSTNTDAYNLDLSARRAKSVVGWLVNHGVKAERLTPKGFGKTRPVADNATAQGRALNRRVEVAKP